MSMKSVAIGFAIIGLEIGLFLGVDAAATALAAAGPAAPVIAGLVGLGVLFVGGCIACSVKDAERAERADNHRRFTATDDWDGFPPRLSRTFGRLGPLFSRSAGLSFSDEDRGSENDALRQENVLLRRRLRGFQQD
jgi:hypothetical protein